MILKFLLGTAFLLGHLQSIFGEREHKVHNIALYPERHSWCKLTPIQQVISSPGYEPVTIENNVCVGACFSYSIPKTEPAEPGELIGPYCDSCQPAEIKCYHVNLLADHTNVDGPKVLQKRVEILTNCSCQSCKKIRQEDCQINSTDTLELPKNMFTDQPDNQNKSQQEDMPDLFEDQKIKDLKHNKHSENDINKLKQWFAVYQNETEGENEISPTKHQTLQELQSNLDKADDNNEKILKDLEGLPKNFGIEGAPSHHKGAHIASGITPNLNLMAQPTEVIDEKKPEEKPTEHQHGHHNHHQHGEHYPEHKHHHHLGEEQQTNMDVGHLVKGPHGSMVLAPEMKLNIDSDALKPNNEGLVMEYENHHHNKNHHHHHNAVHHVDKDVVQEK